MERPKRLSKEAEYWFESGHLHQAEPVGLELLHAGLAAADDFCGK